MKKIDRSPDEFLASFDGDDRAVMESLDRAISSAFQGRSRVLWEGVFWGGTDQQIIGYGDIVQSRPRGPDVEWFAVGLARQKNHFSVYVNAVEDGAYLVSRYADSLGTVKIGASSVGFKRLEDLDLAIFAELMQRARELTE